MLALTLLEMVGFFDDLLLGCCNLLGLCQKLFLDFLPVTLCPVVSFGKCLGGAAQGLQPVMLLVVLVLGLAASCGYSQGFKPVVIGIVWFKNSLIGRSADTGYKNAKLCGISIV